MSNYSRGSALAGDEIALRAIFIDSSGHLIDPDGSPSITPVVYIYDESVDSETISDEMEAMTFSSAISGPLSSTRLGAGYYEYTYTVPTSYEAGLWHDIWVGVVNGITNISALNFTVEEAIRIHDQAIGNNSMIVIELSDTISNDDNNELLESTKLYYTTTYSPLFASPDLIRAEVGPWIDYLPDDTLALMAHWSSQEAEFIQGPRQQAGGNLRLARTKFVIYDAALRAISQSGGGNSAGYTTGGKKTLADLTINQGEVVASVDAGTVAWLREQRTAWWRVVNAGGNIVPGQGLMPSYTVKGVLDPDRRMIGRGWDEVTTKNFPIPTSNRKVREYPHLRGSFRFVDPFRRR